MEVVRSLAVNVKATLMAVALATALVAVADAAPEPNKTNISSDNKAVVKADAEQKKNMDHTATGTVTVVVNAPMAYIWSVLCDFPKYPEIFSRVTSVHIDKREGHLVYIESHLKKQMFVKNEIQHTVNDLSGKPDTLKWQLTDGNFEHVDGSWNLKPIDDIQTRVSYTLEVQPGPFVPVNMVSFVLHFVEKEVANELKKYAERTYTASASFPPTKVSLEPTRR